MALGSALALAALLIVAPLVSARSEAAERQAPASRPGIAPASAWNCPVSHPIKGNFTTYSGERCIYHVPGGRFYEKTKPERCYATEADAESDGCRQSKR